MDQIQTMAQTYKFGGKSLVLLQVNCRSIYNKLLEFWNLVDTYNPDIIIGTESWLREDIGNTEIFRADSLPLEETGTHEVGEFLFVLKIL